MIENVDTNVYPKADQSIVKRRPHLKHDLPPAACASTTLVTKRHFHFDHLERPLIDSLTLNTFCPAVDFAWECSRDQLKKVCAGFLNDRYCEVMMLRNFFELPPECMQGVLKLGYDLKCSTE